MTQVNHLQDTLEIPALRKVGNGHIFLEKVKDSSNPADSFTDEQSGRLEVVGDTIKLTVVSLDDPNVNYDFGVVGETIWFQ